MLSRGKPPPTDKELEARVAALETQVVALQADTQDLTEGLNDLEGRVDVLEGEELPPDPCPEPPDPEEPPGSGTGTPNPDNWLRVMNVSGAAIIDYPLQFGRGFLPGEITQFPEVLIDGIAAPTQANVKNRWPDGSVKFAVIAVVVPDLVPGAGVELTFRNQVRRRHSAIAVYALLDAFPDFDAVIRIAGGGATREASARTMLDAGSYREWTPGPIAQTVMCYDRSPGRVYDMGWSEHRPLHPWFVLTFWPTLGRVFVRHVAEISNTEAMQAQTYDLTLLCGEEVVYAQNDIAHRPATRWTRGFWYGGTGVPEINIDHNVAHLAATGLIANYDPGVVVPETTTANNYASWLTTNRAIGGIGWWQPYMPQTGGRKDLGLMPQWSCYALLTGDWRDRETMLSQAELAGWWQRHMREGDTAKAQYGRSVTCHGRPSYWYLDARYTPTPDDAVTILDPGQSNGWGHDEAHQPDPFTVPYLLTGDPYWLDSLELWAGANTLSSSPATQTQGRGGAHCTVWGGGQVRGQAWTYRTMFEAAALLPDNDPMRAEFVRAVAEAIAKDEGMRGLVGAPSAADSHPYHERYVYGAQWLGTTSDGWKGHGPGGPCRWWCDAGGYAASDMTVFAPECDSAAAHWMNMWLIAALARGRELGFATDALLEWAAPHVCGQLGTPSYPPQLTSQYVVPALKESDSGPQWYTGWAEALSGWSAQKQTGTLNGAIELYAWPQPNTYFTYAMAAAAMVAHLPEGAAAWAAAQELAVAKQFETGQAITWHSDPTWALVPR